jgi:uroporphyrinogen-III synthase
MKSKECVLIARSESENKILSTNLATENLYVISINMIEYQDLKFDIGDLINYEYVILTSKHSCKIIANYNLSKKFLIVGRESANIIKQGSKDSEIISFNSVREITHFIKKLKQETIIYLSGSVISSEIIGVKRKVIYNIKSLESLDLNLINKIKNNTIKYIMLFSKANFNKLVQIFISHDIISIMKSTIFVCISFNIASYVKQSFQKVLYVNEPSKKDMIKLIIEYERT